MRATPFLRMYSARLTLFTKSQCGLCDVAKQVLANVREKRVVDYSEVDIMQPEHKKWQDCYAFDVPVLHVQRRMHTYAKEDIVTSEMKLMHRFTEQEVEKLCDEAEQVVEGDHAGSGTTG